MRFAIVLAACSPVGAEPSAPVVEIAGDLDGKAGNEKVVLYADGTLTAGKASVKLGFDSPEGATTEIPVQIVSLGGTRRGIWVTSPIQEDEDPPRRHRVFLYERGQLREVANEVVSTPVKFSKLGTVRWIESGWDACMRVYGSEVRKHIVTLRLNSAGTKMVKARKPSTEVQNCGEIAACPFVYEVDGDDVRFAGEILRYLRSKDLEATQTLPLGGASTIRIVEEKLETTYLDEVYLDVGGVRVPPKACTQIPSLPYCTADGVYHVMTIGDVLELQFDAEGADRELVARGYYIPTKRAIGSD